MQELKDKAAFVTGAASGIGLGMVRAFLAAGMRVVMADIEAPRLNAAAQALATNAVLPLECDVSDRASVFDAAQVAIAQMGAIHVVCNNAGVSSGGLIHELDAGDWQWNIGVNLLGVVHGCEVFAPHFNEHRQGGHFVNTSSIAGLLARAPGWAPYNSTKHAVVALTEVLRAEGRLGHFSASVLCPSAVNTDIMGASRNRPARFGAQVSKVAYHDISEQLQQGLDPQVVGELVIEAMRADRLHIFTDPRMAAAVGERFAGIADDFAWAAASEVLKKHNAPGTNT